MAKNRRIPLAIARGAGAILGLGAWLLLYHRFTASLNDEVLAALRGSGEFGVLMGVSAAFMVLGLLALAGSLAALVLDQAGRRRGSRGESDGAPIHVGAHDEKSARD